MKLLAYKFCKLMGLFQLTRFLMRNRLNILCYHGFELTDEAEFRPKLFMNQEVFLLRMQAIKSGKFHVLPLGEAIQKLSDSSLPSHSIVLTIDDGFYSVKEKAAAILRKFDFPSTLYVTSYYASKNAPIFRLLVQYLFWRTKLTELANFKYKLLSFEHVDLSDAKRKHKVMWSIIDYGENCCNESARQELCRELAKTLQIDEYWEIVDSRMLSLLAAEEIRQLKDFGIDVQLHTHRHTLSTKDMSRAGEEIRDNRNWLEPLLGYRLDHFCYPSGEWCIDQWEVLKRLGIVSATTCDPGMNTPQTPRFGLLRFLDKNDLPQIEFEAELYGFKEALRLTRNQVLRTVNSLVGRPT